MSVLIVTPGGFDLVRETVRHLRAQTARARLELVVVAPSRETLGAFDGEAAGFARVRVVEAGEIRRASRAKAAGVRAARAPFVAFAEEHCYPEPDWARLLIDAHARGWDAVGPQMCNANPRSSVSRAGLYLNYGACIAPAASGRSERLPWHNVSYRRELLLSYGEDLSEALSVEGLLLDDLRAKGRGLYFESRARAHHVNISRLSSWVAHSFWGGRLFGAARARRKNWTLLRRLAYAGGGPLIPLVRVRRALPQIYRAGGGAGGTARVLPAVLAGLIPHALGEAAGYAFGAGRAEERYCFYEMNRALHLTERDRGELAARTRAALRADEAGV
jgi:Glycosyl transferase family 2